MANVESDINKKNKKHDESKSQLAIVVPKFSESDVEKNSEL